ncbi:hypothetical protein HMF8227_01867 [Saliniradius amylolyticus]|uniref:Imelysin-like domain-containing protein n=1 Tax=Saliniradius amylolyticus TaxID=2183582 RepID=A0A2S2E5U8_9ALTE|nr:imelysin family protein [Saliniradius amylolyticus]AWL12337.1 hypothetical protein HMF8227_01867 [Saliniradius amylolyticus]
MRLHPLVFACASALIATGCGESSSQSQGEDFGSPSQPVQTDFDQNQLLESVVDQVILPTYQQFQADLIHQQDSVAAYCQALSSSGDTDTTLDQAREDWRTVMSDWQQAELMQIGPLTDNSSTLRNRIYSWPNTSACSVDQEVMLSREEGYDISLRTNSRRGLDALEYLLFNEDLNHQCTIAGTEPDGWLDLTDDQKRQARCDFAEIVVSDLKNSADELVEQWQGESGYGFRLKNAGLPDSIYATAHEAVNEVSDALFYITETTKDAKLATPLGLFANDCGAEPCADNVESQYANHSIENIHANLTGLLHMLQGGMDAESGIGFDDYLNDVGDSETAERLLGDLQMAINNTEGFDASLAEALQNNPDSVEALHGEVKKVTDTMKSDFINSLALELPETSAGDND